LGFLSLLDLGKDPAVKKEPGAVLLCPPLQILGVAERLVIINGSGLAEEGWGNPIFLIRLRAKKFRGIRRKMGSD
jgi:hypothetical protein